MGNIKNNCIEIDRHVGKKIRERRVIVGLTQQQLARLIGVTYQQAHKYEHGYNRVSAGRLYQISRILRVGIVYFFEGLDTLNPASSELPAHSRLTLETARNFAAIKDPKHREALGTVARLLAN